MENVFSFVSIPNLLEYIFKWWFSMKPKYLIAFICGGEKMMKSNDHCRKSSWPESNKDNFWFQFLCFCSFFFFSRPVSFFFVVVQSMQRKCSENIQSTTVCELRIASVSSSLIECYIHRMYGLCVCVRVSLFFVCCCSVSHNIDSTLKEKGRAIYNVCSSIEKRQRTTHQKHTQQVKTIAYNRNYKRNGKEICAISRNCLTSKSKRHLIFVRLGNEQKNNSNNNRKNEKVVLVGEKHHRHTTNYRTMKINGIQ